MLWHVRYWNAISDFILIVFKNWIFSFTTCLIPLLYIYIYIYIYIYVQTWCAIHWILNCLRTISRFRHGIRQIPSRKPALKTEIDKALVYEIEYTKIHRPPRSTHNTHWHTQRYTHKDTSKFPNVLLICYQCAFVLEKLFINRICVTKIFQVIYVNYIFQAKYYWCVENRLGLT